MSNLSSKAYQLQSLIKVCQFAAENDTCGIAFEERGIAHTLEFAAGLAGEIIEEAEVAAPKPKAVA